MAATPTLAPLSIANPSMFLKTKFTAKRAGDGLPRGVVVGEELSKGSNNVVLRATCDDCPMVVRRPLRRSDTRKLSSAAHEAAMTLRAAMAGVAPSVYDMWYCAL